jgi:hypothetical protein
LGALAKALRRREGAKTTRKKRSSQEGKPRAQRTTRHTRMHDGSHKPTSRQNKKSKKPEHGSSRSWRTGSKSTLLKLGVLKSTTRVWCDSFAHFSPLLPREASVGHREWPEHRRRINTMATKPSSDRANGEILALLLGRDEGEALLVEVLTGKSLQDVLAQPAALALQAKQLSQEIQSVAYEVACSGV